MTIRETGAQSLFAVTAPGLESVAAGELRALGFEASVETGGAGWRGGLREVCVANLHLRTASRVLIRIGEFRARTFFELERHARSLPWAAYLGGRAARLRVTSRKSRLYHEGAVAQRISEAIARAGGRTVQEPGGAFVCDPAECQLFVVRFLRDRCTVSVDTSGPNLHRRGYRQAVGKAPLRETLAAAVLMAAGWDGQAPLIDPLCGSGTIAIEAALLARRIPSGLAAADRAPRDFAFLHWPGFSRPLWESVVTGASAIVPRAAVPIVASDRNAGAIRAARANADRAGVGPYIRFDVSPLSRLKPPDGPGWLVTNPPYGVRAGDRQALVRLESQLAELATGRLAGWTIAALSPRAVALGPGTREALATRNGGIPVRLFVRRPGAD